MSIDLIVDGTLYPTDVVMGTAYVFTDRCYVLLDRVGEGSVRVTLSPRQGTSDDTLREIAGEFQNELLAQALRRRVAERHAKVREAIVARALFGAAPTLAAAPDDAALGVDPSHVPSAGDDYLEDPLGIAVPWEEKYGAAAGVPVGTSSDVEPGGAAPGDGSGKVR